MMWYIVETRSR